MAFFFSMSIFTNGSSKNVSVHWTTGQRNLLKLTEQNKETSNTLSLELSLKNDTFEKYYAFSLLCRRQAVIYSYICNFLISSFMANNQTATENGSNSEKHAMRMSKDIDLYFFIIYEYSPIKNGMNRMSFNSQF